MSDETYNALDDAIKAHFTSQWEEASVGSPTEFVGDWILVSHFGDLEDSGVSTGYIMETSSGGNLAPHSVRGLFAEGEIWLDEQINRASDDD